MNTLRAQYGYDYCNTLNSTVLMGDSLRFNIDNDTLPDVVLRTYVDSTYGKTARLVSLKPNRGGWYLNDVKFKGGAVNNAENYPANYALNYTLSGSEAYTTGPYIFRENIVSYFNPGDSGYICYSHGSYSVSYDPQFGNDTTYSPCMGWIRLTIGSNLDSVIVSATCGCDDNAMVTGQASPFVNGIDLISADDLRFRFNSERMVFTQNADRALRFELYNAVGQRLAAGNIGKGDTPVDLSPFPHGMMVVVVFDGLNSLSKVYKVVR